MSDSSPDSPPLPSPAPKRTRGPSNAAKRLSDEGKAVSLRRLGTTYAEIATALGFTTPSQARKVVRRALDKVAKQLLEDAPELIIMERLKLDRMEQALAAQTEPQRGGSVNLAAVDRRLRICESRRKLLGLDGPSTIALTGPGGAPLNLAGLTDEELAIVKRLLAPPA